MRSTNQGGKGAVLCVDLDGTLVRTDTLWEGLVAAVRRKPSALFAIVAALFGGKAHFRHLVDLDLPPEILSRLRRLLAETSGAILITGPAGSGFTSYRFSELLSSTCHRSVATGGGTS